MYLPDYMVCGKQHEGTTSISIIARFNNYKSSNKKFSSWVAATKTECFRNFTAANREGLLKDVSFQNINRFFGSSRHTEGFCQLTFQTFIPEGLNVRCVDH